MIYILDRSLQRVPRREGKKGGDGGGGGHCGGYYRKLMYEGFCFITGILGRTKECWEVEKKSES